MKNLHLALVAGLLFVGNGCVVDHIHHDYGYISFDWQFRLSDNTTVIYSCSDPSVSVATIYYELYDSSDILVDSGEAPCASSTEISTSSQPVGSYVLDVEGLSSLGTIFFKSSFDVDILPGSNDLSILTLNYY